MIPHATETQIEHDLTFLVASGPFLLANGNLSAFEELLRRVEQDPAMPTLILVLTADE